MFSRHARWIGVAALALLATSCRHKPTTTAPPEPPKTAVAPKADKPLFTGVASYYGPRLHGRLTANGERFDSQAMTAAHRTLPFGTCLRVVNLDTTRSVKVRVNDRGPYIHGRVIDLSMGAARKIGMLDSGVARVRVFRCGRTGAS